MPHVTVGKIILVGVLAAGAVGLSVAATKGRRAKVKKAKKAKKDVPKGKPLSEVYMAGALLPDAVAADIMLPIDLTLEHRVATMEGDIVVGPETIDDPGRLAALITDINPEEAQMAYDYVLMLVREEGYDMADPGTLDEAIQRTLVVIAPQVDWSQGLEPYTFDSREGLVWRGTQLLGELAHQSHWNKQAPSA